MPEGGRERVQICMCGPRGREGHIRGKGKGERERAGQHIGRTRWRPPILVTGREGESAFEGFRKMGARLNDSRCSDIGVWWACERR